MTLTLRLSTSLSVERKLSRGRARHSSLAFDYCWDMIDLICYKRKPLNDKVHLLLSLMVLGYWQSNREQVTFRLAETSESNGSNAIEVSFLLRIFGAHLIWVLHFNVRLCLFIGSHFLYRNLWGWRSDFSFGESLRNIVCNLSKVKNREKKNSYLSSGIKEEVTKQLL